MRLSPQEEDRLVRQFEPAVKKYARKWGLTEVMGVEDVEQELRLAALASIREFEEGHTMTLSSWVITKIKNKLSSLVCQYTSPNYTRNIYRASMLELDAPLPFPPDSSNVKFGDILPDPDDPYDDLLSAISGQQLLDCLNSKCKTEREKELVLSVAKGESINSVGRRWGVSRQRVSELRIALLTRLREEMAGCYSHLS